MDRPELDRLYPGLADELARTGEDELAPEDIRVETAATGVPVLVIGGLHVHSPRDPVREGRRLAEAALSGTGLGGPLVILGFGLGYAAEAAAGMAPGRPLIIVEKRREILRKAFEIRNLGDFLSKNRIVFVLGKDGGGIDRALSLFEKRGEKTAPVIIRCRALMSLDGDWYAGVERAVKIRESRDDVNRATLKRFGKRWVRNLSRNLPAIRDLPGIRILEGLLGAREGEEGIPVFLAAAGPTLDLAGPFLEEIVRRCVTVAVDTSLRFLLSRGVDPDFVVSVDPQYWNFRHLDRVPAPRSRFVAESAVYPPCLRHPFREVFLCGSLFPLGRFIEDRVESKGGLGAGGSVATTAWDFARILGAPSVWIAGLDLSFPGFKTHFKGALFEDRSHAESTRFVPGETWSVRALMDGQPFLAGNSGGGAVLTDKRLSLYATWFENRFRQYPELRNFSLSGEGLAIRGLETASPEALLALPWRRDEINRRLEGISAAGKALSSPESLKTRSHAYETALKTLLDGLESIKNLAEDATDNAETACRRFLKPGMGPAEREKILKQLDKVNETIANSAVKEVAGFLFPETGELEAADGEVPDDPFIKHLEFSGRFYRALAEAAGYNLRVLMNSEFNHRPSRTERTKPV